MISQSTAPSKISSSFFWMQDDTYYPDRWYLKAPSYPGEAELDPRVFTRAIPFRGRDKLKVSIRQEGVPLEFTYADMEMPVLTQRAVDLFRELAPADIEIVPAGIESRAEQFSILNVLKVVDCFDFEGSSFKLWPRLPELPEKEGTLMVVYDLKIDPRRVGEEQIFRIKGWEGPLIVSSQVKEEVEGRHVTGVRFEPVV